MAPKFTIVNVVGARPNFMKIAPLLAEQRKYPDILNPILLHTGQHYDYLMSQKIFGDLELPQPDVHLDVKSGTHAEQTAKIMVLFEQFITKHRPDLVLVVGDVNSTLACAVVASKLHIPVAHVEAGLRSFDRSMPEEINRLVTDQLSDYLFVTEPSGERNLLNEGRPQESIYFTGNVMIDSLIAALEKADNSILEKYNLEPGQYAAVTLHRPSNVDNKGNLTGILQALLDIADKTRVIFPVHPRTRNNFSKFGIEKLTKSKPNRLIITEPVGYLDFVALERNSRMVLTDSGGIQEECCFLKVPCITLRNNTERPVTIDCGSNRLVGTQYGAIINAVADTFNNSHPEMTIPGKWDGKAAKRIVDVIVKSFITDSVTHAPAEVTSTR